ncbi:ATP-binding protein [uncultured Stenotrophomonas sp.]|uniref:sensor histidine kinase n=1 Tax=uncultured Stenotrophomonas sp. TaxID=165438 RepID=UPI0025D96BD0|nr:ATP-binding protein [uncultured Stenotrophomonas sp.]
MIRWFLLLLLSVCMASANAGAADITRITHAEAVRADWQSPAAPAQGWVQVPLADQWQTRWPDHDGVVWYRLRWQQSDANQATGLLLDYTCMAAAVYLNGSLIDRDPSLVEPLSRSWHVPRYFLLQSPLLKQGENELLVRVSGLAAYQPSLGVVDVGDPQTLQARFRNEVFVRHDLQVLDSAIGFVLAAVIGLFWLLRRKESMYGWYALSAVFGRLYDSNFFVSSPWPFATTDAWQAFIGACYVAGAAAHTVFLLRFCERRWPRLERVLLAIAVLVMAGALLWPQWMGPHRNVYLVPTIAFLYLVSFTFMGYALRSGRRDYQVLALCIILPIAVSLHDLGVYMGWYGGVSYLGSFTSPLMLLGMGFVLAYRFANTMQRVEGFNAELRHEVQQATTQLADTLQQQHALELSHSRAGERLQLVRDLHDGFGGTLVGAIARLEQAPDGMPRQKVIGMLREMRDDLRLVIDSTAREQADLAELLAPLRHRASGLLDAVDIQAHWHLQDIDGIELGASRSLDLLRLLQEGLTNVFKHSRAQRVDVYLRRQGDQLQLHIDDDGVGLVQAASGKGASGTGAGLASMHLRARRLGGELQVSAAANGSGTRLALLLPLMA